MRDVQSIPNNVSLKVKDSQRLELVKQNVGIDIEVTRILGVDDIFRFNGKLKCCQVNNDGARRDLVDNIIKSMFGDRYVTHDYETWLYDDPEKTNFTRKRRGFLRLYSQGTMHYDVVVYLKPESQNSE